MRRFIEHLIALMAVVMSFYAAATNEPIDRPWLTHLTIGLLVAGSWFTSYLQARKDREATAALEQSRKIIQDQHEVLERVQTVFARLASEHQELKS